MQSGQWVHLEMEVPSAFEKKERFALHRWIREAVRLLV